MQNLLHLELFFSPFFSGISCNGGSLEMDFQVVLMHYSLLKWNEVNMTTEFLKLDPTQASWQNRDNTWH